ncbi:uncharacterized protein LOC144110423 [Amblyomma americanum]
MEHSANKRSTANGDSSSFLWNQLVSGAPVVLGLDAYRPPSIRIKDQVLNAAFRTTLDKRVEQSVPSSLVGTVQFSAENDGIVVVLDQLPGCTPSPLRPNIVQVPCKFDKAAPGNSCGTSSKEEWLSKLTSFEDAWHYASLECGLGFNLAITADLAARTRGPSCDLTVAAVTPVLPLRLVPLFPIPVLRSGVQDALSSPHTAVVLDFGFVTLCGDHLCFHFKHQLEDGGFSFIGVWISGVASIEHPFIWLVCAQFATSQRLASRPKEIFAVCVLPSTTQPAAAAAVGVASSQEVLFYNCLCPNPTSLCFQLWQGAATTSVARVPSASNKTISVNLEKVLSGTAAETFHAALKELLRTRAPVGAPLEQSNSTVAQDSWVPTPRPARNQAFNVAPTVPDISDCSMGLASGHSRSENMYANAGGAYAPGMNPLEAATQGFAAQCSNGAFSIQTAAVATEAIQYRAVATPAQSQGQQFGSSGNTAAAQFSPSQQHHWPSAAEHHSTEGLVPTAVYDLIRHQDEQLQELRLQIQRLMNPVDEPDRLRAPDPTPQQLESELCRRATEKLTREAATMTETASSVRLVHRSVQTDKMVIEGSSANQRCTFCGHRQPAVPPVREVQERDTDYTIFFPEKSPHFVKQQPTPHRPSPRPAHLASQKEPPEPLPRPAFAHSRTADSLLTSAVSFRDDLFVPQDRAEKRGSKAAAETFIHPRLQYEEESRLGPSMPECSRDELSMQVDRIAQKYCPEADLPPTPPRPTAKGGTPLSLASEAYLRNYGLASDAGPARGDAGDSMERILDISALKRLPKLL